MRVVTTLHTQLIKSNIMIEALLQPLTDLAPHAFKAEAICKTSS